MTPTNPTSDPTLRSSRSIADTRRRFALARARSQAQIVDVRNPQPRDPIAHPAAPPRPASARRPSLILVSNP